MVVVSIFRWLLNLRWKEKNENIQIWSRYSLFKNTGCSLPASSSAALSSCLTQWGRVTHICANKVTIVCSDNGLSPGRRQAIIWTNAGILLIGTLGTNFSDILIEIRPFSFKKMHLKMSSGKWWPFCLGLNVLKAWETVAYLCLNG